MRGEETGREARRDEESQTSIYIPDEINLEQLFLHEIGHSLGLLHSDVADAVMQADYASNCIEDPQLTQDDIDGIQSLYSKF